MERGLAGPLSISTNCSNWPTFTPPHWPALPPPLTGGVNLPAVALMAVNEELWRTIVPFTFPPDSPNLHMLMTAATPEQKAKYLEPYARGEAKSCIAVSEPGAGADPSGMTTKAEHGR